MKNYIRLNLGITKTYLLKCNDGYMLIDTGYEADYEKFRRLLSKFNIPIEEIKYLLLTHYHDDHSGFAGKLKSEFGVRLIVQRSSMPLLALGDSTEETGGTYVTKRLRILFSFFEHFHKAFKYPPVIIDKNDIVVEEDDSDLLRKLGINAKILFTPGHSEDSMSVLTDDGVCFCGDAAMNFLKFTGTHYRPIYYVNEQKMYESLKKLISNGVKTFVPAHGNPFPAAKVKKLLKKFCN